MSPTLQAVLMFLSSPVVGILVNAFFARVLPAHGAVRKFTTSYLAATPGQVMAVGAALQAKNAASTLQAVEAVAEGVAQAARAAKEDEKP